MINLNSSTKNMEKIFHFKITIVNLDERKQIYASYRRHKLNIRIHKVSA